MGNGDEGATKSARGRLIGLPYRSAARQTSALSPDSDGRWYLIAQYWLNAREEPPQYVVLELAPHPMNPNLHRYTVTDHKADRLRFFPAGPKPSGGSPWPKGSDSYANSNFLQEFQRVDLVTDPRYRQSLHANQVRAENGRIFFWEYATGFSYYDPECRTVNSVENVLDPAKDVWIFRSAFGQDGMIYGGTQSRAGVLPRIVQINPWTLEHRSIGQVGRLPRTQVSYAYWLAVDLPWIYVAVGEENWQLAAIHTASGESRLLEGISPSNISFDFQRDEIAVLAKVAGSCGTDWYWCADGKFYLARPEPDGGPPLSAPSEVRPRRVTEVTYPIRRGPIVDGTRLDAEGGGENLLGHATIYWTSGCFSYVPPENVSGFDDSYFEKQATVEGIRTYPVPIYSMVGLPDGGILGYCFKYSGFFRYLPATGTLTPLVGFGTSVSRPTMVEWQRGNGPRFIYISGYPNSVLYEYNPATGALTFLDRFGAKDGHPENLRAGTHYTSILLPSRTVDRLYMCGERARKGDGSGVGYYAPTADGHTLVGKYDLLPKLEPDGMLLLEGDNRPPRLIFSGKWFQNPTPGEVFAVLDPDLEVKARFTLERGGRRLTRGGVLFGVPGEPRKFAGVVQEKGKNALLYHGLYDESAESPTDAGATGRPLLAAEWADLDAEVTALTVQRASAEQWIWAGVSKQIAPNTFEYGLVRIDPRTLQVERVRDLSGEVTVLEWAGDTLYLAMEGAEDPEGAWLRVIAGL